MAAVQRIQRASGARAQVAVLLLAALFSYLVPVHRPQPARAAQPTNGAGTWDELPPMSVPRGRQAAALLPEGQMLVVSGAGEGKVGYTSSMRFNPTTGTWGDLIPSKPRMDHTATLLMDGRVLVVGDNNYPDPSLMAELYDPPPGEFLYLSASSSTPRANHTATLLTSGRVLVAGGTMSGSPVELFDTTSRTWTPAEPMQENRTRHAAVLLPDGRVLVAGGRDWSSDGPHKSAELYDPLTGKWTPAGTMSDGRMGHRATLLPSGGVLVTGGTNNDGPFNTAELYDPALNAWQPAALMKSARAYHTQTLLKDGRVLVAGGDSAGGGGGYLAAAELYDPQNGTWSEAGEMKDARAHHTATLLEDGRVVAAGGINEAGYLSSVEIYVPTSPPPADDFPHKVFIPSVNRW